MVKLESKQNPDDNNVRKSVCFPGKYNNNKKQFERLNASRTLLNKEMNGFAFIIYR